MIVQSLMVECKYGVWNRAKICVQHARMETQILRMTRKRLKSCSRNPNIYQILDVSTGFKLQILYLSVYLSHGDPSSFIAHHSNI